MVNETRVGDGRHGRRSPGAGVPRGYVAAAEASAGREMRRYTDFVSGFAHQVAMSLPVLLELLEPVFHLGIGVDDEESPLAEGLPVVGAGATLQLVHPVLDFLKVSTRTSGIVMVDDR